MDKQCKNRLSELRNSLGLTTKELERYTNISATVITLLENGSRMFKENHIDAFTDFFVVTSDYLLGKSDYGVGIVDNDGNSVYYFESQYNDLLNANSIDVSIEQNTFRISYISDGKKITEPKFYVLRLINNPVALDEHERLKNKAISLISNLHNDELEKTIKFIEEYIMS